MSRMNQGKKTIPIGVDLTGFNSARSVTPAHIKIMRRLASPWLGGPPVSDILLELVAHMFTEDEAEIARHLPIAIPRTAKGVARRAGLPVEEVRRTLDHLALVKIVVLAAGNPRRYTFLPIVPGIFEMALMTPDLSSRNEWHRRFAEIFERLWETGYIKDYRYYSRALVRYLPVQNAVETLQHAWPSDRLAEILEPYDIFAVGHCQCRLAMDMVGQGCGKPTENCLTFGQVAKPIIERGLMRRTDRDEAIAIKRQAEENGCVTWMVNTHNAPWGNGSCSCCGCCCHGLRMVNEFNVPGIISRPHFMPALDVEKCTLCQKCVRACPMGAWTGTKDGIYFNSARCIGCGLCVVACKFEALSLSPVDKVMKPEPSWLRLLYKIAPGYVANSAAVFARRLFMGPQAQAGPFKRPFPRL